MRQPCSRFNMGAIAPVCDGPAKTSTSWAKQDRATVVDTGKNAVEAPAIASACVEPVNTSMSVAKLAKGTVVDIVRNVDDRTSWLAAVSVPDGHARYSQISAPHFSARHFDAGSGDRVKQ